MNTEKILHLIEIVKDTVSGKSDEEGTPIQWGTGTFCDDHGSVVMMCAMGAVAYAEHLLKLYRSHGADPSIDAYERIYSPEAKQVTMELARVIWEQYPDEMGHRFGPLEGYEKYGPAVEGFFDDTSYYETAQSMVIYFNDSIARTHERILEVLEKAEVAIAEKV